MNINVGCNVVPNIIQLSDQISEYVLNLDLLNVIHVQREDYIHNKCHC